MIELPVRLRQTVEVFPASDGTLYLLRGGTDADYVVDEAGDRERAVLRLLGAGVDSIAELVAALAREGHAATEPELAATLEELAELGLLEEPPSSAAVLTEEQRQRYDRQLVYFGDMRPGRAAAMQAALSAATVAVVGVGALGSWSASGLACAGIGRLVLTDDDTIELSNLNRQILYRRADVGRPKVDTAAEALRAFNPELEVEVRRERVESVEDARRAIAGADFVVEAADWPPYTISRWLDGACHAAGVPRISASQFPPLIRVGPTYVPGRTGCLECQERAGRRAYPLYDEIALHRQQHPTAAATLGAASGLIGSAIAMEVVHLLTGICPPATLGAGLVIDLRDLSITREPVERDPDCPRCGEGAQKRPSPT